MTQDVQKKRDDTAKTHLAQYAPVWIVEEKAIPEDDSLQFNVVFQHSRYGWVNRRYRFDAFNNVLYYKGQRTISEDESITVQEQEPYIAATVADIPNGYGG